MFPHLVAQEKYMLIINIMLMHVRSVQFAVTCLGIMFKIRETLPLFDLFNNINVFPLNSKSLLNTCSVPS